MVGVYKITGPEGGVYIGQSRSLKSRIRKHRGALNSYGCFLHTISILTELPEDVSQKVLDEYERIYISQYDDCGVPVLNIFSGGVKSTLKKGARRRNRDGNIMNVSYDQNGNKIRTHSDESKAKIGDAGRGRPLSEEAKQKLSKAHTGKVCSEETKRKISEMLKNRIVSDFVKEQVRDRFSKVVYRYTLAGEYIDEWESGTKASKALNINRGSIDGCARGIGKTAGGFRWSRELVPNLNKEAR